MKERSEIINDDNHCNDSRGEKREKNAREIAFDPKVKDSRLEFQVTDSDRSFFSLI